MIVLTVKVESAMLIVVNNGERYEGVWVSGETGDLPFHFGSLLLNQAMFPNQAIVAHVRPSDIEE